MTLNLFIKFKWKKNTGKQQDSMQQVSFSPTPVNFPNGFRITSSDVRQTWSQNNQGSHLCILLTLVSVVLVRSCRRHIYTNFLLFTFWSEPTSRNNTHCTPVKEKTKIWVFTIVESRSTLDQNTSWVYLRIPLVKIYSNKVLSQLSKFLRNEQVVPDSFRKFVRKFWKD
jgi:hypothetical protein